MGKIMVVAGEVSGDMHAARVVREIKKLAPETKFFGMGSKELENEGVEILFDPTSISTIGFIEAFAHLRIHLNHVRRLKKAIRQEKPDVLFLVDYSGFNMVMARTGYKESIPVVNYFSPSAWVWGKWRASWMARYNATIASVFPMEAEIYRQAGARVEFVGHPLIDLVHVESNEKKIMEELELDPSRPVVGLLPGSRNQEIEKLLPEMLETASRLQLDMPDFQMVLPLAPMIDREKIIEMAKDYPLILKIIDGSAREVMKIAKLILVASGTATLEAALLETPMIIIYKVSPSTYKLGKMLVDLDYIGLPNIIAGRKVVPELIQEDAVADSIYKVANKLLNHPYLLNNIKNDLKDFREKLGGPGAVERTARLVLKEGKLL